MKLSFLCVIFTLYNAIATGEEGENLTPTSCPRSSTCTALSLCRLVNDLMDRSCLHVGRLQELTCGYLKSEIMVCCPEGGRQSPFRPGHEGIPAQFYYQQDQGFNLKECGRPQIAGWQNRPKGLGSQPWAVRIGFNRKDSGLIYSCAGSLITPIAVLTTAECVSRMPPGRSLSLVQVGEYDTKTDPDCTDAAGCADKVQLIPVKSVITHPDYDSSMIHINNIAIVALKAPVTFSLAAQAICLQEPSSQSLLGLKGFVIGFGKPHKNDTYKTRQQQVDVTIVDSAMCSITHDVTKQLCVSNDIDKAACDRFIGAPLVVLDPTTRDRYIQVGMVSSISETQCGDANVVHIYQSIQEYFSWIQDNLP